MGTIDEFVVPREGGTMDPAVAMTDKANARETAMPAKAGRAAVRRTILERQDIIRDFRFTAVTSAGCLL
jgi:hypothetical protein